MGSPFRYRSLSAKANGSASTRGKECTSSGPSRQVIRGAPDSRDSRFFRLAVAGEAALALLAVGLGRVLGLAPLSQLQPGCGSLLWGVLATSPLILGLLWILNRSGGRLRGLVDFVVGQLGPLLAGRSIAELMFLATLAGLGEELLFRGVVQTGLGRVLPAPLALLSASALFGLAHFATATYVVVAGIMGFYLGALFLVQGSLLAPIITHALYDLVAVLLVARRFRASQEKHPLQ